MSEFLETTYDKFIFRAGTDCLYSREEFWARLEGSVVTVGITDFRQKTMGDVAFVETVEAGTQVWQGRAAGQIETIKTIVEILSPVSGKVLEVNPKMQDSPFLINEDPYGNGWIYRIQLTNAHDSIDNLLQVEEYFEILKEKVAQEAKKPHG
ncbi:MAG: glycine cleavage system protein GcvH [Candidatus Riflebacteria bacterium]|nr:glycine cleavage system protein GcvH [Candidatus Riflebacteria bacterium]